MNEDTMKVLEKWWNVPKYLIRTLTFVYLTGMVMAWALFNCSMCKCGVFTFQDVVKHGTSLNELSKQHQLTTNQGEINSNRGLKSLTREGRKLLDGYQHLFYTLQTTPAYLAKLIFCLPLSRSTRFLETVILTLFNFGSNPREEYLLLKLFKTALEEEIR